MCKGFTRLQTQFHTRMLTLRYSVLRSRILNIQRYCRGYLGKSETERKPVFHFIAFCLARQNYSRKLNAILVLQSEVRRHIAQKQMRRFRIEEKMFREAEHERSEEEKRLVPSLGAKRAKDEAERKYQERLKALEHEIQEQERLEQQRAKEKRLLMERKTYTDENDLFNNMFPSSQDERSTPVHRPSTVATGGMQSTLGNMPQSLDNIERIDKPLPLPDQDEDLKEYTFAKFASTYFQGNATPQFTKKTLKQPLLAIKSERDQLVSRLLSLWDSMLISLSGCSGHLDHDSSIHVWFTWRPNPECRSSEAIRDDENSFDIGSKIQQERFGRSTEVKWINWQSTVGHSTRQLSLDHDEQWLVADFKQDFITLCQAETGQYDFETQIETIHRCGDYPFERSRSAQFHSPDQDVRHESVLGRSSDVESRKTTLHHWPWHSCRRTTRWDLLSNLQTIDSQSIVAIHCTRLDFTFSVCGLLCPLVEINQILAKLHPKWTEWLSTLLLRTSIENDDERFANTTTIMARTTGIRFSGISLSLTVRISRPRNTKNLYSCKSPSWMEVPKHWKLTQRPRLVNCVIYSRRKSIWPISSASHCTSLCSIKSRHWAQAWIMSWMPFRNVNNTPKNKAPWKRSHRGDYSSARRFSLRGTVLKKIMWRRI